jgi:sensor histidine kinase regulating citrate/malate metabolism
MLTFNPRVEPSAEFLEISNDFTDPKEIIREAISNAFDADATEIAISVRIDKTTGEDELVVQISDNGHGMTEESLEAFFGLGLSTRREKDEYGHKRSIAIGEKGHGTKIYFNSRCVKVSTTANSTKIEATMDQPRSLMKNPTWRVGLFPLWMK